MAKKKETWSFIEQPRWLAGSIHNEFVAGKKADYAIQLVPTEALPEAREYFSKVDTVAVIHLPLATIGAAPFRSLERDTIDTANPVIGVQLWRVDGVAGHFVVTADGQRITSVKRRRSATLKVMVRKPIEREAYGFANPLRAAHAAGDLKLDPEPIEVPTRPGKMWLWSARWRELHADPEYKVRPQWLGNDGGVPVYGGVSFTGVKSA